MITIRWGNTLLFSVIPSRPGGGITTINFAAFNAFRAHVNLRSRTITPRGALRCPDLGRHRLASNLIAVHRRNSPDCSPVTPGVFTSSPSASRRRGRTCRCTSGNPGPGSRLSSRRMANDGDLAGAVRSWGWRQVCPTQPVPVLLVQGQVRLVISVDEDVSDRFKIVAATLDEPDMFCRNPFRVLVQTIGRELAPPPNLSQNCWSDRPSRAARSISAWFPRIGTSGQRSPRAMR